MLHKLKTILLIITMMALAAACGGVGNIERDEVTVEFLPTPHMLVTPPLASSPSTPSETSRLTITLSSMNEPPISTRSCTDQLTFLDIDQSLSPQTLTELLTHLDLPEEGVPPDILKDQVITIDEDGQSRARYQMRGNGCTLWLTYTQFNENSNQLILLKYDKHTLRWSNQVVDDYIGQVMGIETTKSFYLIDTHINPSAGFTIILPHDMEAVQLLYGDVKAVFDNDVFIYGPSQIHFAPTHPSSLALYDPTTQESQPIMPPKPLPPLWSAFEKEMEEIFAQLSEDDWCARNNHHCHGPLFTRYFWDFAVNSNAVAFTAQFASGRPYHLSDGQIITGKDLEVIYIFRNVHSAEQMSYREFEKAQLEQILGHEIDIVELLEEETLDQLFIK